ncbi:MAG: hypothetical protein K2P22_08435 [Lachnospiraceae bacterium]|nr:hypothetical protein [Lachnospiraceae bacterium]
MDSNWTNLLPSKAKEVAAESNQLVFWALEGAWVRADGKTAAPTVSGAVNGSVRTDGKRVTFQIGTEPVSALTKKAEATNGNMSGTLEDLLKTAVDGDTITLNNDVSLTGYNTVTSKITLDLKGYVITIPAKSALSVKGNGNMTITNGKIVAGQGLSHQMTQVLDGATMTLDRVEMSGGLCVFVSGKETGKKCTLNVINRSVLDGTETYEAISTNGLDTKSNHAINIEDSTVKGWEALFLTGVTTTTVTNSTIVGYKNGISIKAGTLNLVGDTSVEGKGSYKVSGTLSTNGSNETGSAIAVFEQAPTYAGNIVINVGANVTLKSNAGPEQDGDKPAILALRNGDHSTENAEKNNTTVTIGGSALTKASNAEDLKKAGVLFYNIAKEDTEDQGDSQGTTQNTAESTVSEEDVDVDENVTENTDAE